MKINIKNCSLKVRLLPSLFFPIYIACMDNLISPHNKSEILCDNNIAHVIISFCDNRTRENLKNSCSRLHKICSKNNLTLYLYNPIDITQTEKNYALSFATYKHKKQIIECLLTSGAQQFNNLTTQHVEKKMKDGNYTWEEIKIMSKKEEQAPCALIVAMLTKNSFLLKKYCGLFSQEDKKSLLEEAIKNSQEELCIALSSQSDFKVNSLLSKNVTALYFASQNKLVKYVKYLLTFDTIDVNVLNKQKITPLCVAAYVGCTAIVKLLLSWQRIITDTSSYSPLYFASQNNQVDVVNCFLACKRLNINHISPEGATALYIASQNGHEQVVATLLAHKEIKTDITYKGYSALFVASQRNHCSIATLLLTHSPHLINICTKKNYSPLHTAGCHDLLEMVKILINAKGVNLNIITDDNRTPLDCAQNKPQIRDLIIIKGGMQAAEINTKKTL